MLVEKTVQGFTEELASESPAPGGGSVAALAGSIAASLVSMVSNLTVGKEKYQEYEDELKEVLEEAQGLRKKLLQLVDDDTDAFNRVMAAFKMPKETDEDKRIRSQAIQKAFVGAAELPLGVAKCCLQAMKLSEKVIDNGNPNAASDAGVSVLMAGAGAKAAALNVEINLGAIKDEAKKKELKESLDGVMQAIGELEKKLLGKVKEKIN
ncbi:MAG: methenyltetrahydrofolate cyclohydrolase [Clostridia bacterium]|jgi:formiminotetrahydrofolate cyclodeaminase|nr:Methenyltetrahydrofolate cyclohydrolase [Clostridiales bacterium]MDK2986714.1 methenyltetrahydrofolate cyclohydrolase [Clostridia bacterium]